MNAEFYDRALRRIRLLTIAVGIAGTAALLVERSLHTAGGFLLGAALSTLNFHGLSMLAQFLGGTKKPGAAAAALIALRYALIGCGLYVIIQILGFMAVAVLCGLLAAFGAVILEILYELIFQIHE